MGPISSFTVLHQVKATSSLTARVPDFMERYLLNLHGYLLNLHGYLRRLLSPVDYRLLGGGRHEIRFLHGENCVRHGREAELPGPRNSTDKHVSQTRCPSHVCYYSLTWKTALLKNNNVEWKVGRHLCRVAVRRRVANTQNPSH